MAILAPIFGVFVIFALALLLSNNRGAINWRTVGGAFFLQAGIAVLVLYSSAGVKLLDTVVSGASHFINYANAGIGFVFGKYGDPGNVGFIFALHVLPVIIFISSLIAGLYYLGIMQRIISAIGGSLRVVLGTSRAESTCAAANIFLGQTDAPLIIKPFVNQMTRSELFAIMTGGMASVAGSVLLGYAVMGIELSYLIAASFMAAPGGLLMAKLIIPEVETPVDSTNTNFDEGEPPANIFDAVAIGAMNGGRVAINVGAMLIAFIALIAMINGILGGISGLFGFGAITLEGILGWGFAPIAYLLGVPANELQAVASLIGQKLVLNEFVAFVSLTNPDLVLSEHARAVATFALCGFANIASIAVCLGGLGVIAPARRAEIARLGLRAVAAATLANLMSAALASVCLLI